MNRTTQRKVTNSDRNMLYVTDDSLTSMWRVKQLYVALLKRDNLRCRSSQV
jgi:hypothetical protein